MNPFTQDEKQFLLELLSASEMMHRGLLTKSIGTSKHIGYARKVNMCVKIKRMIESDFIDQLPLL